LPPFLPDFAGATTLVSALAVDFGIRTE